MLETKTMSFRGAMSQYICHQQSEFNDGDITESEIDEEEQEKENLKRRALETVTPTLSLYCRYIKWFEEHELIDRETWER